jgi:hypothetical protein
MGFQRGSQDPQTPKKSRKFRGNPPSKPKKSQKFLENPHGTQKIHKLSGKTPINPENPKKTQNLGLPRG